MELRNEFHEYREEINLKLEIKYVMYATMLP